MASSGAGNPDKLPTDSTKDTTANDSDGADLRRAGSAAKVDRTGLAATGSSSASRGVVVGSESGSSLKI